MRREHYPQLRDLLNKSIETERPLQIKGYSGWRTVEDNEDLDFSKPIDCYRVQPAPPQPKFRPMNDDELMQVLYQQTIVKAESVYNPGHAIGTLGNCEGEFKVSGWSIVRETLTYANPSDPRCGQPLQVEIKDDPQ